jgi:hypothetical protein
MKTAASIVPADIGGILATAAWSGIPKPANIYSHGLQLARCRIISYPGISLAFLLLFFPEEPGPKALLFPGVLRWV